ncbi:hypothetical protein AMECASPLE_035416, partial [Ameca splendens]
PQQKWTEGHSMLMSLCRQTDIILQTGSKSVIRSCDHIQSTEANCVPESSQQRPCLYEAEWSSFPGLKEGQQDRITVVTPVTCKASLPTPQLRRSVGEREREWQDGGWLVS